MALALRASPARDCRFKSKPRGGRSPPFSLRVSNESIAFVAQANSKEFALSLIPSPIPCFARKRRDKKGKPKESPAAGAIIFEQKTFKMPHQVAKMLPLDLQKRILLAKANNCEEERSANCRGTALYLAGLLEREESIGSWKLANTISNLRQINNPRFLV